jgi:hypothetical protein
VECNKDARATWRVINKTNYYEFEKEGQVIESHSSLLTADLMKPIQLTALTIEPNHVLPFAVLMDSRFRGKDGVISNP